MEKKGSGILLHISSLPSAFGIGDLGKGAFKFVDFLYKTRQRYWQILPLNPTSLINCNSPYSSMSAFASNAILINPEILVEEKLLTEKDIRPSFEFSSSSVDYPAVHEFKDMILNIAFKCFRNKKKRSEYEKFCLDNAYWLEDFAMFVVFKENFDGKIWSQWPEDIRDRDKNTLSNLRSKLRDEIDREKFLQYIFFKQWHALKNHANEKGIQIIGDIPIYVTYDSVDVWRNPEIFKLNKDKTLEYVAGVPPDYFSKTGQLWGNPVYNWDILKKQKYNWWVKRIEHNLRLFDWIRIDHFRGFVDFWQVGSGESTAINGQWQKAPAKDFFRILLKRFPNLPIIAEDLGIITDEVREVMKFFGLPGMKILLFAFGEDLKKHPYLPHNYTENCVVYTGTHDNNTVRGWFEYEAKEDDKKRLFEYIGHEVCNDNIHWELIELAMKSIANKVIFPLQDILGLGQDNRMNLPGIATGNWQWRFSFDQISKQITDKLSQMTQECSRNTQ